MTAATSVAAYLTIKCDGTLSRRQGQIVAAMKPSKTFTRLELCKATGLPANVVSARIHELIESGAVRIVGKRPCSISGFNVQELKLAETQEALFS